MDTGLSPRVRGNLHLADAASRPVGSIPACAGEPLDGCGTRSSSGVYPRVCGGTSCEGLGEGKPTGLSPRVRGNHRAALCRLVAHRSIPACAGEPFRHQHGTTCSGVYPRVCGGTEGGNGHAPVRSGLSPRVRGNRRGGEEGESRQRSIPACAGEPEVGACAIDVDGVYPRVCGGTPLTNERREATDRSIPACAGEPELPARQPL